MGYVYCITNQRNNKKYIGISIHEPEKKRIPRHLNGHGSRLVAAAVQKYGKDAFTCEILENNVFDEFLPELEVAYISNFNTLAPHGYNLDSGGSGTPSEETRQKISLSKTAENNHNFGKKLSTKHRRNLSVAKKGKKRKPFSEEHCRNISKAAKRREAAKRRDKKIQ